MYPWCRTTSKYSCPAADLIGKRPVKSADAQWVLWRVNVWLWRGGLTGAEETGAKAGIKERSGGVLLVPLSFLVFLVLGEGDTEEGSEEEEESERRGEAARQDGGGIRLVEAMPCRSWSR